MAYAGLIEGKEVSWMPSYGPEMRGGTANCSVRIADEPIGSPLITNPNALVVMNLLSYDKFIDKVEPGGTVLIDDSLVSKRTDRTDINCFYLPATVLSDKAGLGYFGNLVMLGKLNKELNFCSFESLAAAIKESVSASRQSLLASNLKAIEIGANA